jgi:hypothetical protein
MRGVEIVDNEARSPISVVVNEAEARGLRVQRSLGKGARVPDPRLLHIAGKPCQVIKTVHESSSPDYSYAKSLRLYLPRTGFADFLIYVAVDVVPPTFYIIPRGVLSKDTARTEKSLEEYRNAWHLLTQAISPTLTERKFEAISAQLESVWSAAHQAGLEVELIRTAKGKKRNDYRSVFQRRVLVSGKQCAIYSAVRVNKNLELNPYSIVILKTSRDSWPEFCLYLMEDGAVYVIPRGNITHTTTLSLNSPDLRPYRNAWDLLQGATIRPELHR